MKTEKMLDVEDLLRNACQLESEAAVAAARGNKRAAQSLQKRAQSTFDQACLLEDA